MATIHAESSTQAWKRDREEARKYFERARQLDPSMDVPFVPPEVDIRVRDWRSQPSSGQRDGHELQMPSIDVEQGGTVRPDTSRAIEVEPKPESTVRLRRRRQQASEAMLERAGEDEDNTWYLYLPGLIGAGTALLVVSVVGALSLHSWRKSQN